MEKIIAVIGQGFVGGSLTTVFTERGFDCYVCDKSGKVAEGARKGFSELAELVDFVECINTFTGIYFVGLPTPMSEDGSCDVSIVENVLDELSQLPGPDCKAIEYTGAVCDKGVWYWEGVGTAWCDFCNGTGKTGRIAVVKSTIPPGTTERLNKKYEKTNLRVIFSPEFLTEANALNDMREQNRIVLGGPRPHINRVKQVFSTAFPKVPIIKTSSTTAEMVKYFTNIQLAARVVLSCELAEVCEKLDKSGIEIDYDKVQEYACYDKRLGDSHMTMPEIRGARGHCFPKDLAALVYLSKQLNIVPNLMEAIQKKNLAIVPSQHRDWEKMHGRAVSKKEK